MIKIIDDVISKKYQNELEEIFLGGDIPWYLTKNIVSNDYKSGHCGFGHIFNLPHCDYQSEYLKYIIPLVNEISQRSNIETIGISCGRSFLQIPSIFSNQKYDYTDFHVDLTFKHKVFLYYVNDSDGDTVISDKRYKDGDNSILSNDTIINVIQKVSPKKGRVVVFDGDMFHAAGIPKKNLRCILNFDMLEK